MNCRLATSQFNSIEGLIVVSWLVAFATLTAQEYQAYVKFLRTPTHTPVNNAVRLIMGRATGPSSFIQAADTTSAAVHAATTGSQQPTVLTTYDFCYLRCPCHNLTDEDVVPTNGV